MDYFINGTNLRTFGVEVMLLRGFESFPKRKGETERDYLNQNGVEPFTEPSDVFYEARQLYLDVVFVADNLVTVQNNMDSFFQFIKAGELTISSARLNRSYVTFFKDGAKLESVNGKINGKQYYKGTIPLTEFNPQI